MTDPTIILRSGVHKSRGDTLELRPDALVMRGQHFRDRAIRYADIASLTVEEFPDPDPMFPNAPPTIMISFVFSTVPDFISLTKRSPTVPDTYYLTDVFSFDLDRRDEVRRAAALIEERRRAPDA